jgi:hypothetical protein
MPQMRPSRTFVSVALAVAAVLVACTLWVSQCGGIAPSAPSADAMDDPDGSMLFDRSFSLGRVLFPRSAAASKAGPQLSYANYTGPSTWIVRGAPTDDVNGTYVATSVQGSYFTFRNEHGRWLHYSSATHCCHITLAEDEVVLYASTEPMPPSCRWQAILGPKPAPSVTAGPPYDPAGGGQVARQSSQPPGGHAR